MAGSVREKYTACIPGDALTLENAGMHLAVAIDVSVAGGSLIPLPAVTLTGTTENVKEIYGEYISKSGNRVRVQTCGIVTLASKTAYAKATNGQGVVSSDTAGVVQASETIGVGTGRIFGGHSVGDTHYVYVDLDARTGHPTPTPTVSQSEEKAD